MYEAQKELKLVSSIFLKSRRSKLQQRGNFLQSSEQSICKSHPHNQVWFEGDSDVSVAAKRL